MKQWDINWGIYRRKIVFAKKTEELFAGIDELLRNTQMMCANGEAGYAFELTANIAIDLQSCLTGWVLDKSIAAKDKDEALDRLKKFLETRGASASLAAVEAEAESIKQSQFARIAKKTLAGELFTYWGNDLCTGVDFALRRGASFTTSNPSKINLFRQSDPEQYAEYVRQVMAEHKALSGDEILSYVTVKVVSQVARKLKPIFEATNGEFGVSFTQVSPYTWDDSEGMIEEALRWNGEFKKELNTQRPNVVFKLPATSAAKQAAQELLKHEGIRVTFTSGFATGQHARLYELIDRQNPSCFLVIVDCHLRKYARLEFEAMGLANPDYYCEKLVWAVFQKCYRSLLGRKSRAMINGAGMREDVGIRLCLTKNAELPITLTVTPGLAEVFDSEKRNLEVIWDKPVSDADMAVLERSKIFRQAYYEDKFPWDDIRSFQPFAFMMDGFEEAHKECLKALPKYE